MNKQQRYNELLAKATQLNSKADRSTEEQAELTKAIADATALKAEIESDNQANQALAELNKFNSEPSSFMSKGGAPTIDGQDGTATIKDGQIVDLSGGFELSEKQKKAIAEPSYLKAWLKMSMGREDVADLKQLTEGLDDNGGYLVPPQMINQIIKRAPHPTRFLDFVTTIPTTSDQVKMPRLNYTTDDIYDSPVRIAWTGENGPSTAASDPVWGEITVPVHTGVFDLEYSRDFGDDTPLAIESVLTNLASTAYRLGIENVHLQGNGASKPFGLVAAAGSTDGVPIVNIGSTLGASTPTAILAAIYALPEQYTDSCQVFTNRTTFGALSGIQDGSSNLINLFGVDDRNDGLTVARKPMLQGYPVYRSAFLASPGSANLIGIFGDLAQAYVRAQRLILSVTPYGLQDREMLRLNRVGLSFRFREGGKTLQPRAAQVWRQS